MIRFYAPTQGAVRLAGFAAFCIGTHAGGPPQQPISGGQAAAPMPACEFRLASWNIERGEQLERVAAELQRQQPDMAILQEVDLHTRRTGGAHVAEILASRLGLAYTFAAEFEELSQSQAGRPAYHGQAVLSAWPVAAARIIRFQGQSRHWEPRWYIPNWRISQRRLGERLALTVELGRERRRLIVYDVHLESRGSEELRRRQIDEVIADARRYGDAVPVIVAGDFNTRVPNPPATAALELAGFRRIAGGGVTTTHGTALDWIYVRGPIQGANAIVHHTVRASDHFPLSATLRITGEGCAD